MKHNKILLNIPHSSTYIPSDYMDNYVDIDEALDTVSKLTDLYTDEIFNVDTIPNAESFIFAYSRVYCDIERYIDDELEPMSKKGMGYFYTHGINGKIIRIKDKDATLLIDPIYHDYHNRLRGAIKILNDGGFTPLLLDCHSFSNQRFINDGVIDESGKEFPDICIGYNETSGYNKKIIDKATLLFKGMGFKVRHNYPYSGSLHYSDLDHDSLMIEINKKLYLDSSNGKRSDFYKTKNVVIHVIKELLKEI